MAPRKKKDSKAKTKVCDRQIIGGGKTKFKKQISESSKQYLLRQAKDVFVKKARNSGYRSRAAFKLIEIDNKHNLLQDGMSIVDLGAAPGGWSQLLSEKLNSGRIVAIDKIPIDDIPGVTFLRGNFEKDEVYEELLELCPKKVNGVISDMAPETCGHAATDHLRCMNLVEMAADFAFTTLKEGGFFLAKIFQGGEEIAFRDMMRKRFDKVTFEKPDASRKESREQFILCRGFKG